MEEEIINIIELNRMLIDPIIENKILRCQNCYKIPKIEICNNKQGPYISYSCDCISLNEIKSKTISLKNFVNNFSLISLNEMMCSFCRSCIDENNIKDMFICLTCLKLFCDQCLNHHQKKHNNNININKFDNYCFIHNEQFISWCINCRKNLCESCIIEHIKCKIISFNDIKLKNSDLENYKFNLKSQFSKIIKLKYIMFKKYNTKEETKQLFNLYKKNFDDNYFLFIILSNILNTYSLYECKLNYQIIENVKNCSLLNTGTRFDENNTIEENKEYLKTYFIINFLNNKNKDENIEHFPFQNNTSSFSFNQNDDTFYKSSYNNSNSNSYYYNRSNNIDNNSTNYIINDNNSIDNNKIEDNINNYTDNNINKIDNEKNNNNIKYNISKLKKKKIIENPPKQSITYCLQLNNKRIAIANCIYIQIIDETTLKELVKIKKHKYQISTLAQLKDIKKRLVSGDVKGNIKVWIFDDRNYECDVIIKSVMDSTILKLIHLSNQKLASLTEKIIEIWNIDNQNEKFLEYELENNQKFSSLLETQNNILVSSSPSDNLRTYDVNTLKKKKELSEVNSSSLNGIIEIYNNRIAVGSKRKIFIINMNAFELEFYIPVDSVVSSLYLLNDNTLLVAQNNLTLSQYDINTKECLGCIKDASPYFILSSCQISKFIITACFTYCIFWEFQE